MTAVHFVQLVCAGLVDGCANIYPRGRPAAGLGVNALRESAAQDGWEVMRGKYGRDLCPACRVIEIQQAAKHVSDK